MDVTWGLCGKSPHHLMARTSRCGRDSPGSTPGENTYGPELEHDSCTGLLRRAPGPPKGAPAASMHACTMEHLPSIHEGRTTDAPLVEYIVAIDVAQI